MGLLDKNKLLIVENRTIAILRKQGINMKLSLLFVNVLMCASTVSLAESSIDDAVTPSIWATTIIKAVDQLPAIKASEAEIDASAFSQEAASKPLYNPELSVGYDNAEDNEYGVELSQTIDWSGKRRASSETADALKQVTKLQHNALRVDLLASAIQALNAQSAASQIERIANQQVRLLRQLLQVVDRRLQTGDMGLLDAELARLSLSEAIHEAAEAENEYRSAQGEVEAALGKPFLFPNPSFDFSLIGYQPFSNEFILSLPAVRVAYSEFQATKKSIQIAKAESRADPTIGLGAGKEGDQTIIGLTFSLPLHLRNNYRSEVDIASADALAAEQRFLEKRRLALVGLKTTSEQYHHLYNRWISWKKLTGGHFQKSKTLLNQLWESGDIDTADYVFGLQQRMQALHAGIAFERDLFDAWVSWLKASGQIESWLQDMSADKTVAAVK